MICSMASVRGTLNLRHSAKKPQKEKPQVLFEAAPQFLSAARAASFCSKIIAEWRNFTSETDLKRSVKAAGPRR
jgi:hypothetical protein